MVWRKKKEWLSVDKKDQIKIDLNNVLFIFTVAFIIRIIPVLNTAAWTDLYDQQAIPILKHLNIYSVTNNVFPYSPVSMFIPALCAKISILFKLPFHVIIRLPAVMADVCISMSLYIVMAKRRQKNAFLWGLLYAANPVSVLISAFHGNIISMPTLFTFLAYAVLLFGVEENYRLSALLLGIGIGFRGYPVLLLPLFLIKLKISFRKKLGYIFYSTIPTALSFIPFLVLDYKAVMREVFAYSGFPDYGLGAIMRAIYAFRNNFLAYGLPDNLLAISYDKTKVLFLIVYAVILLIAFRKRLVVSILAVYLAFYFVYTGISSQYFIWILPFAFLTKDKFLSYYMVFTTWALVNFYWLYHPHIIFGKIMPIKPPLNNLLIGEILSLSLLWVLCLVWTIALLIRRNVSSECEFL